jgi:hypothetical protein
MFKKFPFMVGWTGGVLFVLAVNVDIYLRARGGAGLNSVVIAGFPFKWYVNEWGSKPYVMLGGLAADVLIAAATGFIVGLVFRTALRPDRYR